MCGGLGTPSLEEILVNLYVYKLFSEQFFSNKDYVCETIVFSRNIYSLQKQKKKKKKVSLPKYV